MRRLPVYLVIDISESMAGENIRQMQEGMNRLINQLRRDPYALESVYISVIGFAGAAGTLAPLTELINFYLPRLPIGSGTSIGTALNHVMDRIDKEVIPSTAEQKGDWKPLVYFMSDGSSTDDTRKALQRWKSLFKHRAKLINIGIGKFADLSTLDEVADLTYRLDDADIERVYQALCETIATSISSQSRSLGIEIPVSLSKELLENSAISLAKNTEELTALDENYAIIAGLCRKVKLPYLMKWERFGEVVFGDAEYHYIGAYPLEKDYEDWSDPRPNNQTVKSSQLIGGGGCPHCGSPFAFAMCDCGQVFCIDGLGEVVCPKCGQECFFGFDSEGDDFEINRARG
ncbi:TerY-C metal binding domain-containing protein [Avibacterium avium]|uniref:TerY-C metal binding domain-containing protein n=1 Tax=Avibacterium TaxID=292486 RepID=UPI003BF84B8E